MQPCINWTAVDAIAEVVATVITALSIIILVWQTVRQAKQRTKSTIRTEISLLHNERQRLESDVTQIDIELSKEEHKFKAEIERLRRRRGVLSKRTKEVSGYYSYMLKKYKDVLPDLAFFTLPDELKDRCLEEYVQCLDKARENQEKAPS
jgi:hypothetical protein